MAKPPEGWKISSRAESLPSPKKEESESLAWARSTLTLFKGLKDDWITPWSVIVGYYEPLTEYEKGVIKNKGIEELREILEEYVKNWDPQNGPRIEGEPQPVYIDEVASTLADKIK